MTYVLLFVLFVMLVANALNNQVVFDKAHELDLRLDHLKEANKLYRRIDKLEDANRARSRQG